MPTLAASILWVRASVRQLPVVTVPPAHLLEGDAEVNITLDVLKLISAPGGCVKNHVEGQEDPQRVAIDIWDDAVGLGEPGSAQHATLCNTPPRLQSRVCSVDQT